MPDSFQDLYGDLLPDGALPVAGLRLILYLSPNGDTNYKFRWAGSAPSSEVLGLLELVKGEILLQAIQSKNQ